jgi:hypothetical protein
MQTQMGATKSQGVVSAPGKLGAAIRNPWENLIKPDVVDPVTQGWADFKAGITGQPMAGMAGPTVNPAAMGVGAGATQAPQAAQAVQALGGPEAAGAIAPAVTGAEILGTGTAAQAAQAAQAAAAGGAGGAGAAGLAGPW